MENPLVKQLVDLPNDGQDKSDFDGEMEACLRAFCDEPDGRKAQDIRNNWTLFMHAVCDILQKGRITDYYVGEVMVKLSQNQIRGLKDLRESDMDIIADVGLPSRFKNLLTDCKQRLDIQRRREALLQHESLSENSRLEVEKSKRGVTKISYLRADGGRFAVWEKPRSSEIHNLQSFLKEEGDGQDLNLSVEQRLHGCRDQFDPQLLAEIIRTIDDDDRWQLIDNLSSYHGRRGEMVFQQAVYPPFTLVLLAAASKNPKYTYVADQDVLSSSFVICDHKKHRVNGQPDAGLMLESKDPLAEIEIKSLDTLNHHDLAKCILWSSITGQALQETGVPRTDIRLPFIIGSGFRISLFVTLFPDENDISRPEVRCLYDRCSLLQSGQRKKVFVDFVRLVAQMKRACEDGNTDDLIRRRKTKVHYPKLFSSSKRKRYDSDHSDMDEEDGDGNHRCGNLENQDTAETSAMVAVSQVCPDSTQLEFPWPLIPCLFDDDEEGNPRLQQRSPFYFRGQCSKSLAFFKVWRFGDPDVVERFIQDEVCFLKQALDAGVSVPRILHQGATATAVKGSNYFVLAMADVGSNHRVANYDELVSYSLSLLQNTHRLHFKTGILYCDFKPDNIVWDNKKKQVCILDFGHAQEEKRASCVRGTKGFIAPEIRRGEVNTRASDGYGIGAALRFLQKEVPEQDDRRGIRAIADALMTPDPKSRISLDQACDMLLAQLDQGQPSKPCHKKVKTGETDNHGQSILAI